MTRLATRRRAGLSLLEVMISALLLAVVAMSVTQGFVSLSRLGVKASVHHERTLALAAYVYASIHELDALSSCQEPHVPSDPVVAGHPSEAASAHAQDASKADVCLVSRSRCSSDDGRWRCEGEGSWWVYRIGVRAAFEVHYLDLLRGDEST